ncbi:MAG: MarR family transcriptional regulator [Oscillospiraceae bacterium]|nr:MarR family transcriptional regulator [Oscillospiraceae bacterium]
MKKAYKNNDEKILAGFRRFNKILRLEAFGHHGKSRILSVLCAEGAMPQKKLQEAVEISSGSASELLRKMEEHGLIARTADPADSRGLIVEATAEGQALNAQLAAEKGEKAKKLFSALTEEEKEQFAGMLDKIYDSWYEQGLFYGDSKRHRKKHNCQ